MVDMSTLRYTGCRLDIRCMMGWSMYATQIFMDGYVIEPNADPRSFF